MGYLDKQSRVVDIVLTELGRKLYSVGDLDFTYFAVFDDQIDYDPWSTGSLGDQQRRDQIEATPIMEAPFVRDVRGAVGPLEPASHIFTASPGYNQIPHMISPADGTEIDLMADQRRAGGTYIRTGTSLAQISMALVGDTQQGNPGYVVRLFTSGSNGLQQLDFRRDLTGRRAYDSFVAVSVDSEVPVDLPSVNRPNSTRIVTRVTPRKR